MTLFTIVDLLWKTESYTLNQGIFEKRVGNNRIFLTWFISFKASVFLISTIELRVCMTGGPLFPSVSKFNYLFRPKNTVFIAIMKNKFYVFATDFDGVCIHTLLQLGVTSTLYDESRLKIRHAQCCKLRSSFP